MQTLVQTLQDHDRGHLSIIAQLWDLDLPSDRIAKAAKQLSQAMLDATPTFVDTLPGEAKRVLEHLQRSGGRAPLENLVRQFGPLRYMGPGQRDRLLPWREPASPLEMLWYRGLMARAFADSAGGPQEYGFVPEDLLARMPLAGESTPHPPGEPAIAPVGVIQAGTSAVDDATTLLAAYRQVPSFDAHDRKHWLSAYLHEPGTLPLLVELLSEGQILNDDPRPALIRRFLQAAPDAALRLLLSTWQLSSGWNDLAHTPGLINPRSKWPNDPLEGRSAALRLLDTVPRQVWWSLASFIDALREREPDFLRPPGGFESWYLQSEDDGGSLRGFENWDRVEGQYLTYLITGPMHWLGLLDLSPDRSAFRMTVPANAPLQASDGQEAGRTVGKAKPKAPMIRKPSGSALVRRDGRVRVSRHADRTLRYQIARLTTWEKMDPGAYYYRLTAKSLKRAEAQGLTAAHAHSLLEEISAPVGVLQALERWSAHGAEAEVRQRMVLELESPQVLDLLQREANTARYLKEALGPTSTAIDPRDLRGLQSAALQIGLLIGGPDDLLEEPP